MLFRAHHLVSCLQIGPVLHQTLHDVHEASSRRRQQWTLALAVLGVNMAASLAERPGYCRVSVPGSAVQRGLLLLEVETNEENV